MKPIRENLKTIKYLTQEEVSRLFSMIHDKRDRAMFNVAGGIPSNYRTYDVTPGNRRFLMIEADEKKSTPNRLNVVLDWLKN